MISNEEIAREVRDLMLDLYSRVDQSMYDVRASCGPAEVDAYSKALGHITGAIMVDVLGPLFRQHPQLKPEWWDG
jgi:hypothetical protein